MLMLGGCRLSLIAALWRGAPDEGGGATAGRRNMKDRATSSLSRLLKWGAGARILDRARRSAYAETDLSPG